MTETESLWDVSKREGNAVLVTLACGHAVTLFRVQAPRMLSEFFECGSCDKVDVGTVPRPPKRRVVGLLEAEITHTVQKFEATS